jgi:hypothetical protein
MIPGILVFVIGFVLGFPTGFVVCAWIIKREIEKILKRELEKLGDVNVI